MLNRRDLQWEQVRYLRIGGTDRFEFELQLYKPLADWDVYEHWERSRTRSMRRHLDKGDILYDIGAEYGWQSVVYGQMVGPSNMVLIEPSAEFWPNIRAVWSKNFDAQPLATYHGLFGDTTTSKEVDEIWPRASRGDLVDHLTYTYLHENSKNVKQITIDEYVKQTGIVPNALTMDTEGSELAILKGAVDTLANHNLKIWVAIHPDLAEKNYGVKPGETVEFMHQQGYMAERLGVDHEEHWRFYR